MKIWEMLKDKGKFTTILGLLIIIGSVVYPIWKHNHGVEFTEGYLFQTIYLIVAGTVLIILPSKIKVSKDGLEIED